VPYITSSPRRIGLETRRFNVESSYVALDRYRLLYLARYSLEIPKWRGKYVYSRGAITTPRSVALRVAECTHSTPLAEVSLIGRSKFSDLWPRPSK
jgi:hypothetical protein